MKETFTDKKFLEFLIFKLMDEYFAFPAEKTLEIVQTKRITILPKMASFFCGVLNLRGELIPSVDLRLMLGMEHVEDTKDTVYVLLGVENEIENYSAAVRVDRVIAVERVFEDELVASPEAGSLVPKRFLDGCFLFDGSMILVLSPDSLLSITELKLD